MDIRNLLNKLTRIEKSKILKENAPMTGNPQAAGKGQYKVLHRDNEVLVVQLEDYAASSFWGRNTIWSTAGGSNGQRYFDNYSSSGTLAIIVPKQPDHQNEKYQIWVSNSQPGEYLLCDEIDREIKVEDCRFSNQIQQLFPSISSAHSM